VIPLFACLPVALPRFPPSGIGIRALGWVVVAQVAILTVSCGADPAVGDPTALVNGAGMSGTSSIGAGGDAPGAGNNASSAGGSAPDNGASGAASTDPGDAGLSIGDARSDNDLPAEKPAMGPNPDPAARMKCTGTDPVSCHFGGQPGNYALTVVLGGAAAGSTAVQAETHRSMLNALPTTAGQTKSFSFVVNVRQPEGQPIQDVPAGLSGLDVYFAGSAGSPPQLQGIGYASLATPFMIYIAGDSTVCDQEGAAFGGWGQMLPAHFDYPVSVANYADSGESSGSFLNSKSLFGAISSRLKPNDWVLIQFGHNDKTVSASAFHESMTQLVTGVKAKGASPVLVTPVARAQFNGNSVAPQHINGTGANLPQIIQQVATEQNVPLLDLTARTVAWLTELGPKGWQAYHANGTDVTHTNQAGATVEAGFVRDLIRQANIGALGTHMR
jgi:lysophospholipase L1-like esterase